MTEAKMLSAAGMPGDGGVNSSQNNQQLQRALPVSNAGAAATQQVEISLDDIQNYRDKLKKHFKEEIRLKNSITQYERDLESKTWSLLNKRAELNIVIKEKGQSNIQVKIINEEIDEVNQVIGGMKQKLEEDLSRMHDKINQRDGI